MVNVIFYLDEGGICPVLEFLDDLSRKEREVTYARIDLLRQYGHILRRPYVENLGGGLYELRWHIRHVQYRILFFFHDRTAVVLAYALTKEAMIPPADLVRARRRKERFEQNPALHTHF